MKNFFSHDEGARNDPKLIKVLMRLGQAGKGVYWDLVEMLYEQDGYLMLSDCESYAFALRTENEVILSLINDFGLFENDGQKFWSNSVLRRLDLRKSKSQKAAESAQKRWKNANGMRTHSEGNANKEKESKIKESTDNNSSSSLTHEDQKIEPQQGDEIAIEQPQQPQQSPPINNSGDSYFHFCNQLKTEVQFFESTCMSLKIKKEELPEFIDQFAHEQRALGTQYKEFIEFKQHCFNWLRSKKNFLNASTNHAARTTPTLSYSRGNDNNPRAQFGQGADLTGVAYVQESFK